MIVSLGRTQIVTPATYTPPIRTVVIQPIPKPTPEPYISPTYTVVAPPVAAEAVDSNTALWIAGALVGGLILGSMSK